MRDGTRHLDGAGGEGFGEVGGVGRVVGGMRLERMLCVRGLGGRGEGQANLRVDA